MGQNSLTHPPPVNALKRFLPLVPCHRSHDSKLKNKIFKLIYLFCIHEDYKLSILPLSDTTLPPVSSFMSKIVRKRKQRNYIFIFSLSRVQIIFTLEKQELLKDTGS